MVVEASTLHRAMTSVVWVIPMVGVKQRTAFLSNGLQRPTTLLHRRQHKFPCGLFHTLPKIGSIVGSLQRPLKGSQTQQMYLFYAAEVGTSTKVEPESRNSPFPLSSQREMLSIKVVWKRNAKWIPWACFDFSRATKILHHPKWKMPEDLFRYPQNVIKSQNSQNVIIRLPVVQFNSLKITSTNRAYIWQKSSTHGAMICAW